mgnify:CR=1 FL=1
MFTYEMYGWAAYNGGVAIFFPFWMLEHGTRDDNNKSERWMLTKTDQSRRQFLIRDPLSFFQQDLYER